MAVFAAVVAIDPVIAAIFVFLRRATLLRRPPFVQRMGLILYFRAESYCG